MLDDLSTEFTLLLGELQVELQSIQCCKKGSGKSEMSREKQRSGPYILLYINAFGIRIGNQSETADLSSGQSYDRRLRSLPF